jgi:hypothetical protein
MLAAPPTSVLFLTDAVFGDLAQDVISLGSPHERPRVLVVRLRNSVMAFLNSWTLLKVPRRMRVSVNSLNHRSMRFNHDELVGTKCKLNRGLRASHRLICSCLCTLRHALVNRSEEDEKFLVMPVMELRDDRSVERVLGCEAVDACRSAGNRSTQKTAAFSGGLRYNPTTSRIFLGEVLVLADLECTRAMRLQTMQLPKPVDGCVAHAHRSSHASRGPLRRSGVSHATSCPESCQRRAAESWVSALNEERPSPSPSSG